MEESENVLRGRRPNEDLEDLEGSDLKAAELAVVLNITEAQVRRYTRYGILIPIRIDAENGRTKYYDPYYAKLQFRLMNRLRGERLTLPELGGVFRKVCGAKNARLIELRGGRSVGEILVLFEEAIEREVNALKKR